jgi:ABC-type nickel/cobalt efflux system permease component RcnA
MSKNTDIITTIYYCTAVLILAINKDFYNTGTGLAFAILVCMYLVVDVSKSIVISAKQLIRFISHFTKKKQNHDN